MACLSILSNEEKPICLSYEQLWIKVDELKRKLAKFLRKDTKLMITICHSMGTMEEIIAVCACLTLPVIVIPLDPSVIPKVQFLQTLKELQISVILGLSVVHALVLDHSYRYIITSDDDDHHLDMYVHEDAPFSSPPCFPYPLMCPKARQSCCYILYTSGSTGRPKGVCGSYAGLFHRIQNIWTRCPFVRHQDARVLRNTQLGFIDSWNEIFSTLLAGKSLVLVQNSSCSLIERIGKSRITRVTMVPSLFQTLCHISSSHLNHPNDDQRKSRPTSFVLQLSGETCPPALLAQARDFFKHHHAVFAHMKTITILNLYGTTETAGDNALRVYEIKKDGEFISPSTVVSSFSNIGSPFGQNVMLLMNVDDAGGTPREISSKDDAQVGEVWISGPQVALGYVNQKEQSQIYFIDYRGRRYFRTGDYGQWQKEGESAPSSILFHGRQDDQIKIRGHRLDILDIETTCSRIFHHVVKIVPVHKEENAPPVLIALVVMSKAHEEVEEWFWNWQKQLKSIAGLHLSPVAMPSFYIPFRSVLPQLSSGKIDRLALKEYAVKEMQARVWRAPTGGMEQFEMEQNNQKLFQEIVERITKVKVPSDPTLSWMDKHSFEDLGGTSLDAIVFLSEINRCWQLQLQPADVIHVPLQSIFDTVSRLPASEQPQRATKRHKGMLDHDDAENNDKTAELQIKWKVHGKKCIDASALIIESKNLLVIGSHSRDVFAIDLDSGDVRWQTQVRGRVEASATVDALVSHVYLGCYEGHVYAFVLDSGTLQWTFQTGATIKSSPAIDPVSHVLWCGSYDHYIYGLCPESGSCFYRLAAHGSVYASPIFDLSTQIMVSATTAGRVMAHRLHMPSHDDDDDDEDEDRLSTLDMLWQVDVSDLDLAYQGNRSRLPLYFTYSPVAYSVVNI